VDDQEISARRLGQARAWAAAVIAMTLAVTPLPDTTALVRELRLFGVATDLMAGQ
jgi:hypothetical protein